MLLLNNFFFFFFTDFINDIRKNENFNERINNLLQKLYKIPDDSVLTDKISNVSENSMKKLIVLFHGSICTDYQETACRTAKILDLPLLNLDQLILKAVSLEKTPGAIKLANQIDQRYKYLTSKFEKLTTSSDVSTEIFQLSRKIPTSKELERMDSYTSKEIKLEVIKSLLESTLLLKDTINNKSKQNNFNIDQADVYEILHDEISRPKFERGYVLQTLNNDFIKSDASTIKILLRASGEANFYLLVSFFEPNDLEINEEETKVDKKTSKLDFRNNLNGLLEAIKEWEIGVLVATTNVNRFKKIF